MHEPFQCFMGWTEEKVGRETNEKPSNGQVQRVVHFFRLNAAFERETRIAEKHAFELLEPGIEEAKFFETIGT